MPGGVPVTGVASLWAFLCAGEIKLENNFLICPNGACWSALSWESRIFVKNLFIRQCYEDLYKAWSGASNGVDFIGGTSGIGKSTFIWYVLFRLMDAFHQNQGQAQAEKSLTFLWMTQSDGIYVLYSDGFCVELQDNDPLPLSVDYCLIDIGKDFKVPKKLHNMPRRKTLITASFMSEQEGIKLLVDVDFNQTPRRDMPIWSKEDMEVAAKSILGTDLDTKKLHAIFLIFGGSLKFCILAYVNVKDVVGNAPSTHLYINARNAFVDLLKTSASLASDGIPELADSLLKSNYVIRTFENPSYGLSRLTESKDLRTTGSLITHTISSGKEYTDGDVYLSSQFTALYVKEYVKADELNIRSLFRKIGSQALLGGYFEFRGHILLPTVDALPDKQSFRYLDDGLPIENLFKFQTPNPNSKERGIALFRTINEIRSLHCGYYGKPIFSNFPVIDFVIQPNIIGNFTVSVNHHLEAKKRHHLIDIRRQLKEEDESKHLFLWVVIDESVFKIFPLQDGYYTGVRRNPERSAKSSEEDSESKESVPEIEELCSKCQNSASDGLPQQPAKSPITSADSESPSESKDPLPGTEKLCSKCQNPFSGGPSQLSKSPIMSAKSEDQTKDEDQKKDEMKSMRQAVMILPPSKHFPHSLKEA